MTVDASPTDDPRAALAQRARARAFELYEGRHTPHRSCGVAIAETFGRPHGAYQALRKGGITGCGECGALVAGRLVLGELLGDPSPTGAVTPALRAAVTEYERLIRARFAARTAPGTAAPAASTAPGTAAPAASTAPGGSAAPSAGAPPTSPAPASPAPASPAPASPAPASIVCNDLTAGFADFSSPARAGLCTDLAALVAETVAEVAIRHGITPHITPRASGPAPHEESA